MARQGFPLQWPDGSARTPPENRLRSKFGVRGQVSFSQAYRFLRDELDRLVAINVAITSDLPVRHDGTPYSPGRAVDDPGVAVWFMLADKNGKHTERTFACDRWLTHAENMTAIAKSIEALRGLDRWGMADAVERAFSGFTALPAGGETSTGEGPPPEPRKRPWREVLADTFTPFPDLDGDELLVLAKSRHRKLIQLHHPDRGGDAAKAAEINAALAEAEKELQS